MRLVRALSIAALGLLLLLPSTTSAQPVATVNMTDDAFDQTEVDIPAGSTVLWNNGNGRVHTVTADDGSFDSGDLPTGKQFTMEFDTPGTYAYYCMYHGDVGGVGMSGMVVVS
jgi:plastocyanin